MLGGHLQLLASKAVKEKMERFHNVSFIEVEEAFFLHRGKEIEDARAQHKTNPPTTWFVAETFDGRLLKVVIINYFDDEVAVLRTAYEPSEFEVRLCDSKQK